MPVSTALYPDPPPQKWFRLRKAVVWAFWIGLCLAVATVIWALIYVNDKGFTRKWRRLVTTELARRGVHAKIARLTLNPVEGLVARDVELLDPRDQRRVVASINELVLNIDYSGLVHGRQFLRAMDLYNARISLPLDPDAKKSDVLDIEGLNATVRLPPNKVEFDAEAVVHGLRVKASGRLANPTALRSAIAREESEGRTIRGHQFLRLLDRLEITGGDPLLELQLDGDLSHPDQLHAKATLHSGPFTVGGTYPVKSAKLHASYLGDGLLRLNQCVLTDRLGELDASGLLEVKDGRAVFALNSSIDLQGLMHALRFSRKVDEFVFYSPPLLELSGEITLRGGQEKKSEETLLPLEGKLMGSFSVGRFTARSVMFEGAGAEFSWDGTRWFVRDGRLSHRSGNLAASLLHTPEEVRFKVESNLPPAVVYPLLPAGVTEALDELEFTEAPHFRLNGRADGSDFKGLEMEGEVTLGATIFRKVPLKSFRTRVTLKDNLLSLEDFRIDRKEGKATGSAEVDLKKLIVTLRGVRSNLIPQDLAIWIDKRGDLPIHVAPYRFRKQPDVKIDGSLQIIGDDATRLRIDVDGRELDYHFITRDLYFPKIKGTLWVIGQRLKIEDLEGELFDGKVTGRADISINPAKGDYNGSARVDSINFLSLAKLYLDYKESKGKLSGTYEFHGQGHEVRNLHGKGTVSVTDGNVFDIPLFGPFSGILNSILPGTGYNTARKASASFTMGQGMAETKDLEVQGKGFSMYGAGKLFYLDDKIDFAVRINAQGPAGIVLTPVSHLFEYVSDQSLLNPVWRPKRLPKGFFAPSSASQTPKAKPAGPAPRPPAAPSRPHRARP